MLHGDNSHQTSKIALSSRTIHPWMFVNWMHVQPNMNKGAIWCWFIQLSSIPLQVHQWNTGPIGSLRLRNLSKKERKLAGSGQDAVNRLRRGLFSDRNPHAVWQCFFVCKNHPQKTDEDKRALTWKSIPTLHSNALTTKQKSAIHCVIVSAFSVQCFFWQRQASSQMVLARKKLATGRLGWHSCIKAALPTCQRPIRAPFLQNCGLQNPPIGDALTCDAMLRCQEVGPPEVQQTVVWNKPTNENQQWEPLSGRSVRRTDKPFALQRLWGAERVLMGEWLLVEKC